MERISVIGIHRFLSAYLDKQKWKCHKSGVWRCIFSITVISERWWILTRLPQWITMQWQKFNTTASPHHPHERWIQNTDGHITFSMPLQLLDYKSFDIFWVLTSQQSAKRYNIASSWKPMVPAHILCRCHWYRGILRLSESVDGWVPEVHIGREIWAT